MAKTKAVLNKAVVVGILAAVSGIAFLIAFTFFRKGGYGERDSYRVFTYFEDATGLTWKSRVQIAGIQVGEVEKIILQGHRARLELRIRNDIDVRRDGCVTKRFPSALLPDALLDLAPGTGQTPSLRELPEEERELVCVNEGTTVARLLDSLQKITADVQRVTGEMSDIVAGSEGSIRQIIANLESVSRTVNENVDEGGSKVQDILDSTRQLTGTLAGVTGRDQDRYHEIAANLASATRRLDEVLRSVQGLVGEVDGEEGSGGIKRSIADAQESLRKLNATMDQVQKIATSVGEGKSVAGKLLTDERLGTKLGDTIETVSDYVDRLNRLQIRVDLRSEWLLNQRGAKTYAGFSIIPRPDKYYVLKIVNDPRGVATQAVQDVYTETPAGPVKTTTTTIDSEQRVSFTVQFAKRYGPTTFRVGLVENTGGAGADLHLLDDALTLSLDVFQFWRPGPDRPNLPRAKLAADYRFFRYFYLSAGLDDFLVPWRVVQLPGGARHSVGQDLFFGAGLTFTDDDLKSLFSTAGSSVSGAGGGGK